MKHDNRTKQEFINLIVEEIPRAQKELYPLKILFNEIEKHNKRNEFLFFIKPEITLPSDDIKLEKIIISIIEKIYDFQLQIRNIRVLTASYLDDYHIIEDHYGVISKLSKNVRLHMTQSAEDEFFKKYNKSINEVELLGSFEFLHKYLDFTDITLNHLWQNKEFVKLAPGTYCVEVKLDSEIIYLINGFHPQQLYQYIKKQSSIVVFTLIGDINWYEARKNFIGATNPKFAEENSLRKNLFDHATEFGLKEVSSSNNGVHLSAGPVESLLELQRFTSDFTKNREATSIMNFKFGRQLKQHFTNKEISFILSNPIITFNNKKISVFDITEEKEPDDTIEVFKIIFKEKKD